MPTASSTNPREAPTVRMTRRDVLRQAFVAKPNRRVWHYHLSLVDLPKREAQQANRIPRTLPVWAVDVLTSAGWAE